MAATSGDAEETVIRIPVNTTECVPVKSVRDIQFEEDVLALADSSSFDYGEILVLVSWASPPGNNGGNISEDVTTSPG